jgi:hypothetical protein
MAQPPITRRINREDLPGAPSWVDIIIVAINQFFDTCRAALTRQLTFDENFDSQRKTVQIIAGATVTANKFRFAITMTRKPTELIVTKVNLIANTYQPLAAAPWADWHLESGEVVVDSFHGLTSGQKYDITVRIF